MKKRANWAMTFLSNGGFQHVYMLLVSNQFDLKELENQNIVESLLKIVNFFMLGNFIHSNFFPKNFLRILM